MKVKWTVRRRKARLVGAGREGRRAAALRQPDEARGAREVPRDGVHDGEHQGVQDRARDPPRERPGERQHSQVPLLWMALWEVSAVLADTSSQFR